MADINTFLKENLKTAIKKDLHLAPDIPEKKLNKAAKAYGMEKSVNTILALYDSTLFGTGEDGLLFTGKKFAFSRAFQDPIFMSFEDIDNIEHKIEVQKDDKGKESRTESIIVQLKEGRKIRISGLGSAVNYPKLKEILKTACTNFDSYEEENQLVTLAEMPEELKVAYVKVIINMTYADDGLVDEKEFAEILQLMVRLDLSTKSRFELRSYIIDNKQHIDNKDLIDIIDHTCIRSHRKSIHISLTKDLISTQMSTNKDADDGNFPFLNDLREHLNVSDAEIGIIIEAIKTDKLLLRDDISDDAITKSMKELAAKASAVGIPMAAVYLSGSVLGMSAAGLTSGLASLGLGGMLGFSSMATGIGVAVVIGVITYKGVKNLTGANELDKVERRKLMLLDVIKQTQSTISMLVEDINFITKKLNQAIQEHGTQDAKIKELSQMMSMMAGSASIINEKHTSLQNSASKLECPHTLNLEKLRMLTKEPTKQQLYDLISSRYEEREVTVQKDGKDIQIKKLLVKRDLSTKDLDSMAKIFQAIGYFDTTEVLAGHASDLADSAKKKLSSWFS